MRRISVGYLFTQSMKSLWRNGLMTSASVLVLMSCLIVMGSFGLLVSNINYNLESIDEMTQIVAFVDPAKTQEEVDGIYAAIYGSEYVADVTYVSKTAALEQEREKYAETYPDLFDSINDENNPYPDSFVVTYNDPENAASLVYFLENTDGIYRVNNRSDIAENIASLKNGIIMIFIWFMAMLFVVSIFVIINTIKLAVFSRRKEIEVMRYVGATNSFITVPFMFEGAIIGLIASVIAYFLQRYIYIYIEKMMVSDYKMISILGFSDLSKYVLIGFFGIGILTGVIGSVISMKRYLKA